MSAYELFLTALPFFYFMFIAAMTPGPNNVMLTASGMNFGYARTIPHILGIIIGFQVLILLCLLGVGALYNAFPPIEIALKVLGSAYLAYLAYKIYTAGRVGLKECQDKTVRPMNFIEAAAFQFINPKGVVFAIAAVSFLSADLTLIQKAIIITCVCLITSTLSTHTWTLFGKMIAALFRNDKSRHIINALLAIALLATIPMMLL